MDKLEKLNPKVLGVGVRIYFLTQQGLHAQISTE
jgi:hypothetical protein